VSKLKHLRLGLGGAIAGAAISGIVWQGDLTAQHLLAIIGFGLAYIYIGEVSE
jgi:hypothetical protein